MGWKQAWAIKYILLFIQILYTNAVYFRRLSLAVQNNSVQGLSQGPWPTTEHQSLPWCCHSLSFMVFLCVFFRGPRRSPWGFLWLLRGTLPWHHLCGDPKKADLVLCPQSAHPLRAALLHDSAGLPAACKLGGEDQPGWGVIGWWIKCCFCCISPWSLHFFPSFVLEKTFLSRRLVSASRHHGSAVTNCLHADGCRDYARNFWFCPSDWSVPPCIHVHVSVKQRLFLEGWIHCLIKTVSS